MYDKITSLTHNLCVILYTCIKKGLKRMREGIHPNYDVCTVKCACGNVFETRSTSKELKVDICSKCHPFFTGRQKLVDSGGRVDRFNRRLNASK